MDQAQTESKTQMGFLAKLKLLFIIQKPAGEILDAIAEAKSNKKWIHFAVTVLSIALSSAAAWSGYLDPNTYVIVSTALNAIYNVVRGADKADNSDVKGPFTSTELYLSMLTEAQKFVVNAHAGGVTAPWLEQLNTGVNLFALMLGQNLAARAPNPMSVPKTTVSTPDASSTTSITK